MLFEFNFKTPYQFLPTEHKQNAVFTRIDWMKLVARLYLFFNRTFAVNIKSSVTRLDYSIVCDRICCLQSVKCSSCIKKYISFLNDGYDDRQKRKKAIFSSVRKPDKLELSSKFEYHNPNISWTSNQKHSTFSLDSQPKVTKDSRCCCSCEKHPVCCWA